MQIFLSYAELLARDPLFMAAAGAAAAAILVAGVIGLALFLVLRSRTRALEAAAQIEAQEAQARILELARLQTETAGQIQQMGSMLHQQHSELQRSVNERLDAVTQRLGQSMQVTTQQTNEHLNRLGERLAVIDRAQKNITELASQVTSLQSVLSNKQTRGAFGQGRMEMIIQDGLPKGSYEFQYTLSNRMRPDCAIFLPDQRPLIIDAKFPLEAVTAYRDADSEEGRNAAAKLLRQHIGAHVADIARKYLIPGETQDLALMFVPSESVYAELHDGFDDIVQKAYRSKVVIVSPSLLMLAIQVIQQIQKDARMREAADKIHAEVGQLMDDLKRLHERVLKLQQHFGQANEDVRQILISAEKVEKRATKIKDVDFDGEDDDQLVLAPPLRRVAGD
jgi:DNA recombination protein RmuC